MISVKYLVIFNILFCSVFWVQAQKELRLDFNCYPPYSGYVLAPTFCTCRKTDPKAAGLVQWVFPNGTIAKQNSSSDNMTSTLTVESPHKYALNQSYSCRNSLSTGQKGAELNYTANFIFGPESPVLKWAQEPQGPIYLCPSNETNELKLQCQVPSQSVNPSPVYTIFINGIRWGGYDRLGGQLDEATHQWNRDIIFKLNKPGNNTVSCHVRNLHAAHNWTTLTQIINVSDQAPASFKC